jgi:hypothetical protein
MKSMSYADAKAYITASWKRYYGLNDPTIGDLDEHAYDLLDSVDKRGVEAAKVYLAPTR